MNDYEYALAAARRYIAAYERQGGSALSSSCELTRAANALDMASYALGDKVSPPAGAEWWGDVWLDYARQIVAQYS